MQDNLDIDNNNELNLNQLLPSDFIPNLGNIPKIRVAVRKRPCSKKEIMRNDIDIIENRGPQTIIVKELKSKLDLTKYIEEHHFSFDNAYDEDATNEMIYLETVRPMIEAAFQKSKITCFAYGQTGSGKTYTMMGNNTKDLSCPGLYLLSSYDVFAYLEQEKYSHLELWVSFYEIYCNKLFDLLNERNVLLAREDGKGNICIVGLSEKQIDNLKSLMALIDYGLKSRTVGITGANMDSSRSHAILQLTLKEPNGSQYGKISFIDLAGSERAVDTIDTNRQTKIDGAEINKSLLALKECIRALDQEKKHTPFRGSKLTLVLRDSFMGNCRTLMIANISPCLSCSEHTLNTLRYADRVKELRKERSEREGSSSHFPTANTEKDPTELLANLLMMPRQHNKTVKYSVDLKKPSTRDLSKDKPSQVKKGGIHINQMILSNQQPQLQVHKSTKNIPSSNNNNFTLPIATNTNNHPPNKTASQIKTQKVYSNQQTTGLAPIQTYVSKYRNSEIRSDEDFQKLSNEHEKLINEILQEEEEFIGQHKSHIDDMVDLIKQEMNLIHEVDKPGSDIEFYASGLDKILSLKVEKINALRGRLNKFHIMLKDEETLSSKFMNSNDISDVYDMNKNKNFDSLLGNENDDEAILTEELNLPVFKPKNSPTKK